MIKMRCLNRLVTIMDEFDALIELVFVQALPTFIFRVIVFPTLVLTTLYPQTE